MSAAGCSWSATIGLVDTAINPDHAAFAGGSVEEYAEALASFADGSIDTTPMVTRTVTIEELPAAFAALAEPTDCKVVVIP